MQTEDNKAQYWKYSSSEGECKTPPPPSLQIQVWPKGSSWALHGFTGNYRPETSTIPHLRQQLWWQTSKKKCRDDVTKRRTITVHSNQPQTMVDWGCRRWWSNSENESKQSVSHQRHKVSDLYNTCWQLKGSHAHLPHLYSRLSTHLPPSHLCQTSYLHKACFWKKHPAICRHTRGFCLFNFVHNWIKMRVNEHVFVTIKSSIHLTGVLHQDAHYTSWLLRPRLVTKRKATFGWDVFFFLYAELQISHDVGNRHAKWVSAIIFLLPCDTLSVHQVVYSGL